MNGFNEACRVAIEKGGYKEKALEAIFMETTFDSLNDWYNGNQETYLVLDPLFWQSLGKALGWLSYKEVPYMLRKERGFPLSGEMWIEKAHQYFDLVLTGGDTEKFWQDLLNPNRE